jgi:hypothetical protein
MPRKRQEVRVSAEAIERQIYIVRGQRVMLDSDLAALYGVSTTALNQAVQRNAERFPADFAFRLTQREFTNLMSQIVTSSSAHGGRRKLPWVFTEHGLAMLSGVLRSPMAIKVNIEIMRAFVRLRRLLATPGELVAQLTRLAESVELHEEQIKVITDVLRRMMEPPPEKRGRRIGFQVPEPSADSESYGPNEPEETCR